MGLGSWLAAWGEAQGRSRLHDLGQMLGAIDETAPDDLEEEAYLAGVRDGIAWASSRRGVDLGWGGWESERLEETLARLAGLDDRDATRDAPGLGAGERDASGDEVGAGALRA